MHGTLRTGANRAARCAYRQPAPQPQDPRIWIRSEDTSTGSANKPDGTTPPPPTAPDKTSRPPAQTANQPPTPRTPEYGNVRKQRLQAPPPSRLDRPRHRLRRQQSPQEADQAAPMGERRVAHPGSPRPVTTHAAPLPR